MPIHNWSKVEAGLFHHFHQAWSASLCDALNAGRLPPGYGALIEQAAAGMFPDVLTVSQDLDDEEVANGQVDGSLAVAVAPPKVRFSQRAKDLAAYAAKANRIVIHHGLGQVVAAIEIVSPGNKSGNHAFRAFLDKSLDFLRHGVHLMIVDLLQPTRRDPHGVHAALWSEFEDGAFDLPADKPLTLASYMAGLEPTYFLEPVAVGDALPDMPLFLSPERYVPVPLESTYQEAWNRAPAIFRKDVLKVTQA